jgi:hypothetical protein
MKIFSEVLEALHADRQRKGAMLTANHRDWYAAADMM